jgi:hypothetical protein
MNPLVLLLLFSFSLLLSCSFSGWLMVPELCSVMIMESGGRRLEKKKQSYYYVLFVLLSDCQAGLHALRLHICVPTVSTY